MGIVVSESLDWKNLSPFSLGLVNSTSDFGFGILSDFFFFFYFIMNCLILKLWNVIVIFIWLKFVFWNLWRAKRMTSTRSTAVIRGGK